MIGPGTVTAGFGSGSGRVDSSGRAMATSGDEPGVFLGELFTIGGVVRTGRGCGAFPLAFFAMAIGAGDDPQAITVIIRMHARVANLQFIMTYFFRNFVTIQPC